MNTPNDPPSVLFANGKGGPGKTTACLGVALAAIHELGKIVGYLSIDEQKSLTKAVRIGTPDHPALKPYNFDPTGLDLVLLDGPPRVDDPGLTRAFRQATLTVIVTKPSAQDLWSAKESIDELQKISKSRRMVMLINDMEDTAFCRNFRDMVKAYDINLPILNTFLGHYPGSFRNMFLGGWADVQPVARTQLISLTREILKLAKE